MEMTVTVNSVSVAEVVVVIVEMVVGLRVVHYPPQSG